MAQARETNLVLRRADGERHNVGSVVWWGNRWGFKTWADDGYIRRNNQALGLNERIIVHLRDWGVRDVHFVFKAKGTYTAPLDRLLELGSRTRHPGGWGWNRNLPLDHWTLDRSGLRLPYVQADKELVLDVGTVGEWEDEPAEVKSSGAELPEAREPQPVQLGFSLLPPAGLS